MRVTFLLPNLNLRGGVRVVLDYANLLTDLGVAVTVVFPTRLRRLPFPLNEIEYLWRAPHKLLFGRWFDPRFRLLAVPSLDARYVPRADVLVATAWQTAEWASTYPLDRGAPVYFIQDIETYVDGERAGATYRLRFRRIVNSPWVRDQLSARFGVAPDAMVPHGLDCDLYRPTAALPGGHPVAIGALFDKSRRKGFDLVLQAVERVRVERPDVILRVFGIPRRPPQLPSFVQPQWHLSPAQTPGFYHSCDIWLCASRSEGMHLPPMEALASGCALVTTRIGGTSYYAIPERTALVCEPGDGEGLSRALSRLLDDEPLRLRLAEAGSLRVRRFDRREHARHLLRALSGEAVYIEPDTGLSESHCE